MDKALLEKRLEVLLTPVYQQIQMCDDPHEVSLLCMGLINVARHNLDLHLGEPTRRTIFKEWA